MIRVRDLTKKIKEYKGHQIVAGAGGKNCPCMPCWNVHDCGYTSGEKHFENWDCATRYNGGCPPLKRPSHLFKNTKRFQKRKNGDKFKCLRCGQELIVGNGDFDFTSI